jgi:hypothetical protein
MLQNIKLKAGLYTELAGNGRFVNVVLAAGELQIRLRSRDGSTFQTQLVSGMAFELPRGFVSAAFLSEVTQQTKVWLSDLPLTYTPVEQKIVGSTAVISNSGKAFFGNAAEMLAQRQGRKGVSIFAKEDFYIGGSDVNQINAVKVAANETTKIDTQAAIYAFSLNSANAPKKVVIAGSEPEILEDQSYSGVRSYGFSSAAMAAPQAGIVDKVYVLGMSGVNTVTNDELRFGETVFTGSMQGEGGADTSAGYNNHYYGITKSGNALTLVDVDMATGDYVESVIYTHTESIAITRFRVNNGRIALACNSAGYDGFALVGDLGGEMVLKPFPAAFGTAGDMQLLSTGAVVVTKTAHTSHSNLNDAGFSVPVATPYESFNINFLSLDRANDTIYIQFSNFISKSENMGVSWEAAFLGVDSPIASVSVNDNSAIIAAYYKVFISDGYGGLVEVPYPTEAGMNASSAFPTPTGEVYITDNSNIHILQGETKTVGGLDVAIMEEIN